MGLSQCSRVGRIVSEGFRESVLIPLKHLILTGCRYNWFSRILEQCQNGKSGLKGAPKVLHQEH